MKDAPRLLRLDPPASELEERVAKAIFDASGEEHWERQPEAFLYFYRNRARAAVNAIGIDKILEALRPFVDTYEASSDYEDLRRADAIYRHLGGK